MIFQHSNIFWSWSANTLGLIGLSKNKFFQTLLNLSNLAYFLIGLKAFKMSPNGIKMAVFFWKQLQELPSSCGLCPQTLTEETCSLAHNLHVSTTTDRDKLTTNKLTTNNADWLRRAILNIYLLYPEPSCRLAEKGDPKYIFTIPRAILPKPSLCDKINATKSLLRGQFVAISWLGSIFTTNNFQDCYYRVFE